MKSAPCKSSQKVLTGHFLVHWFAYPLVVDFLSGGRHYLLRPVDIHHSSGTENFRIDQLEVQGLAQLFK